jgi:hypothetical protein
LGTTSWYEIRNKTRGEERIEKGGWLRGRRE